MSGPMRNHGLARIRLDRKLNVKLMYWHIFCFTIYQSICQWNLFDAYLSFLAKEKGFLNSNTWVGFAEGIMGITTLIVALPLGIIVDLFNRILLLKFAGGLGIIAAGISAYAFAHDHLATLYANLFLWGLFCGLQGTAAEAVFADSIDKGKRSEKFTRKGMLSTAGLSLGPLLMLGLFFFIGDDWRLSQLHVPLLVGCCFAPLCCIPFFLMRDPRPAASSDSTTGAIANQLRTPLLGSGGLTPRMIAASPMLRRDRIGSHLSDFPDEGPILPESEADDAVLEEKRFMEMSSGERAIPLILTMADFITEVGAGMTVRFFPLFFIQDYGVSPRGLCAIFCIYPLCVSLAMPVCQWLSKQIGRAQASMIFQTFGIVMLLLMTYIDHLPLLIVVFLVRGQLQNAGYPIDRSILMDYVPSKHRGKWNSIASLTTMTWSGSAVLGGYLADRHDFRFTFFITAGIYVFGVLVYSPLLWLVPRVEAEPQSKQKVGKPLQLDTLDESPYAESDAATNASPLKHD